MAEFLFEIGLEEVPARMIAGAQAELQRRVVAMLERERLVAAGVARRRAFRRRGGWRCWVSGCGGAAGGCQRGADGAGGEDRVQGWRAGAGGGGVCEEGGGGGCGAEDGDDAEGRVSCGDVGEGGARGGGGDRRGDAEGAGGRSTGRRICTGVPGKPERFVRPVRWMVALLGEEVVPVSFGG